MTDYEVDISGNPFKNSAGNFDTIADVQANLDSQAEAAIQYAIPKQDIYPVSKYI